MLDSDASDGTVSLRRCSSSDVVCLGRDPAVGDCFLIYSCLITNIHVRFPLDEFSMGM